MRVERIAFPSLLSLLLLVWQSVLAQTASNGELTITSAVEVPVTLTASDLAAAVSDESVRTRLAC